MTKPVLVVGAGPVGLTMAAELARYRVPVRIIDEAAAPTDKSKALAVWARTLELLDRAGAADPFAAAGVKVPEASIRTGDEVIARIAFDAVPSRFPYALMIPQSETERLLAAHLRSLGVTVERSVALTDFSESGDGVTCAIDRAGGGRDTIEAAWLAGCDGAHSTVRRKLGMAFEGDTLATNFILADVHVSGLAIPETELAIFWHEDGVLAFFPIAPGRFRVIADVGSAPRHDPAFAEVQSIVARRGPTGATLSDPIWLAGFAVNERKVADYRAGRVFLAGDAAHVHSPAGGQGMNTGMQDAFNLSWKLALVARGLADPQLLDSYSVERSAVAKEILADSGRMTRIGLVRSRLVQDVRNFLAHRILGFADAQHAVADRLSEVTIGYPHSPLNAGSARGLQGPALGERIVDVTPFGAGDRPLFALLANESAEAQSVIRDYASLVEPDPRTPASDSGVWLVRPDGYVAAAAHASDLQPVRECLTRIAADKRGAGSSPGLAPIDKT